MNRREYEIKEPERKYKIEILCFVFWGGIIWQKIGYFPVSKNVEYKFTLPEAIYY